MAVLEVSRPICMAAAFNLSYSSAVAPAVAAVDDMAASKVEPVLTLAAVTAAMAAPAAPSPAAPIFPIVLRPFRPALAAFMAAEKDFSSCPAILMLIL